MVPSLYLGSIAGVCLRRRCCGCGTVCSSKEVRFCSVLA